MFKRLRWRLAPIYVLVAILTIPVIEHGLQLHHTQQLAAAASSRVASAPRTKPVSGTPARIVVPAAAIDVAVVPGSQDSRGTWSVAPSSANYATVSAPANNRQGQTLIYGHNNRHVFAPLLGLKPGDSALVYTANGHILTYRYGGSHDVVPTDTAVLGQLQQGTGLVLMTCDGDDFQFRHLMYFHLEGAV